MSSEKKGAPAWMVSFGDMMTLILTFFILLVSLSKTQQIGLVASGVGSFVLALRSFGLPGVMDEYEQASVFENVRRRFHLPPEDDPERRDDYLTAASRELVRAEMVRSLRPHGQIVQPAVALFAPDESELDAAARRYVDLLAPTLRPGPGQVLLLEGHALDAGARHGHDDRWLAFRRAAAVRDRLVEVHEHPPARIEVRAWLKEIEERGPATRTVDARLVIPERDAGEDSDG